MVHKRVPLYGAVPRDGLEPPTPALSVQIKTIAASFHSENVK